MELSTCDCGARAPSMEATRTGQCNPETPKETSDTGLNVSWTGLVPWLGIGLNPTSDVQESER